MKVVMILPLLLCAVPLLSQNHGPKVGTGSRVPSLTIYFTGLDGANSKFSIRNNSAHAVTAFALLVVPKGVKMQKGHLACHDQCTATYEVDDIDHPAITPHNSVDVKAETANVLSGSLIVESAVFDDGTYAGNERMAAYLVAQQLGNQQEFDRIVATVDAVMSGNGLDTESKADRLNVELGAMPVGVDGATVDSFYRWFPNVRDCSGRFAGIIEKSASQERSNVLMNWGQFYSGGARSDKSVTQWWDATEKYLAGLGCRECAAKMANPNPPVRMRSVSIGCNNNSSTGNQGVWLTVELADDSDAGDGTSDGADQSVADNGDGADAGDTGNQLVMNSPPDEAEPAPSEPSKTETAPAVAPPRPAPVPPKFIVSFVTNAILEPVSGSGPTAVRRVQNTAVYQSYFYYVVAWTRYLTEGGTPEAAAKSANSPDPFPLQMNPSDHNAVTQAAYECVRSLGDYMSKQPVGAGNQYLRLTPDNSWKPVPPEEMRLRQVSEKTEEGRAAIVDKEIAQLQAKLGKVVFGWLDDRVHTLYRAVPGRLVREPLTDEQMLANYFRYAYWLNQKPAKGETIDEQEKGKMRADEQKSSGLNDDEQVLLQQVADDFQDAIRKAHSQEMLAARERIGVTATSRPLTFVTSEAGKGISEAHITELKSKLGEASFKKLDKRAHVLYQDVRIARVVELSEAQPPTPKAKASLRQMARPQ